MNNQFKDKMVGCGTTPKFDTGIFFCVHPNTSPVTLEDCSRKELSEKQAKLSAQTSKDELIDIDSLKDHYEYENKLIHRQEEIIKALEKQVSEIEQDLLEKDKEITRLENDLEEVCEELFLEVNLR